MDHEYVVQSHRQAKKNLVIVRAGDGSLHPSWLIPEGDRNWDLVVSYYGDDPDIHRCDGIRRIDCKGTEYPAFKKLLTDPGFDWSGYEYIWLPDDDLAADGWAINRFFDLCEAHGLLLAQPSLDHASHISYPMTLQDHRYTLRWTNFVEVMAPCFRRSALLKCLDTFSMSQSSYGIDYLWAARIGGERSIAIVDAVSICHTRPVGGPLYGLLASMGIDAETEKRACLDRIGIDQFLPTIFAGLNCNGNVVSFRSILPDFLQAIRLLFQGNQVAAYLLRQKMRGTGARPFAVVALDQIFSILNCPNRWFDVKNAGARSQNHI